MIVDPQPGPAPGPSKPVLRRFQHINRRWDTLETIYYTSIKPGEYFVTSDNELISTVLGSCIAVCIRDTEFGVGGMNHFMLPHKQGLNQKVNLNDQKITKYGNYAMDHLIEDIVMHGGRRENFEVKVFGGGRMPPMMGRVGEDNIDFIKVYLKDAGLSVTAKDVGGDHPRRVNYYPASGRIKLKRLPMTGSILIAEREDEYLGRMD